MYEPKSTSWPKAGVPAEALAESSAAPLRVLLAEDTPINAEVMLAMTRYLSIRMDHAANGLDAIAMLQEAASEGKPYSLLLLDVNMPILDGVETARRLRADGIGPDELPIIAVTAATDLEEVRAYRAAGMQAYLEKPVGLEDLRATLKAWGHRTRSRSARSRTAAMEALKGQFADRKIRTIASIEGAIERDTIDEELVMELRTLLHQLAGTAGSFGDPELGEVAREQEAALLEAFFADADVRPVLKEAQRALKAKV